MFPRAASDPRRSPGPARRVVDFALESGLAAGAAAAMTLLLLLVLWQVVLPVSLALALGVYLGVALLLPATLTDPPAVAAPTGSTGQAAVAAGVDALERIGLEARRIDAPELHPRVEAMALSASRILDHFREHPEHAAEAQFAFEALTGAALTALGRYRKFSDAGGPLAQHGAAVLLERVFPTIESGLQRLLDRLLRDDVLALGVDALVLEQMLDLEGLALDAPADRVTGPMTAASAPGTGTTMQHHLSRTTDKEPSP